MLYTPRPHPLALEGADRAYMWQSCYEFCYVVDWYWVEWVLHIIQDVAENGATNDAQRYAGYEYIYIYLEENIPSSDANYMGYSTVDEPRDSLDDIIYVTSPEFRYKTTLTCPLVHLVLHRTPDYIVGSQPIHHPGHYSTNQAASFFG